MLADYFKTELFRTKNIRTTYNNYHLEVLQLIQSIVPNIDKIWQSETGTEAYFIALQLAKKHTDRAKVLILAAPGNLNSYKITDEDSYFEAIASGSTALLCEAIANSAERIAAIVVTYHQASTHYYKKVRELASAEGAVMIWDALDNPISQFVKISKSNQPDIICFSTIEQERKFWIGSKVEVLNLISLPQV